MSNQTRGNRFVLLGLFLVCVWRVYDRQQLRRELTQPQEQHTSTATLTDALTKPKARKLATFYTALADILERDADTIKTTGVFRLAHGRALALAFQKTETAGAPKVGELVDAVLFDALGREDRELDKETRATLIQAVREIVTACEAVK